MNTAAYILLDRAMRQSRRALRQNQSQTCFLKLRRRVAPTPLRVAQQTEAITMPAISNRRLAPWQLRLAPAAEQHQKILFSGSIHQDEGNYQQCL
ncbi:hypothetical protein A2U01_0005746 [Trifolium medium]|uniref:Uncharacterized protein n=1 Tax=Trifolium medium TaxID=97028 RepID=A0A392MDR0_9FABA|nr:hypothetical protein [Trifolium medium]